MSLQIERQLRIQERINAQQTVKVDELSEELDVSPNTIRRDLTNLERQGVLKRTQGGAMLPEIQAPARQSFDLRSRANLPEKKRIGQFAATLVNPGSTIMLDAGTSTQQLAEGLTNIQNVTVATNSLEVGYTLMTSPNITVILSGGIIQGNSRALTGLPAERFFTQISADQLFLGTCGISLENGLTNRNMHEISVKQKMIEVAREVILLADHTKFGKSALSSFAQLTQIHKIITDDKAPQEIVSAIESQGIEVIVAREL
ncbi:MAG: DeoR/GlpR transcriptional regulator [bacterium]|nr:DeoR/GlpR transcriptional regulator [bacterium]